MLRQQSGVSAGTRAVFTPAPAFAPKQTPQLATVADPAALEAQIQAIVGQFNGVGFDEADIAVRKAFLERVERQALDLVARTDKTLSLWNRQQIEFQSLVEYDAEVQRLRAEKKAAETMLGAKRKGEKRSRDENMLPLA